MASVSSPTRPAGLRRPLLFLIAAVLGLGGLGAATGMALGAVGATSATDRAPGFHHRFGPERGFGYHHGMPGPPPGMLVAPGQQAPGQTSGGAT